MTKSRIVYIAGPMTGLPNCNRYAFHIAARVQQALGHKVLNPATLPDGLTEPQYMAICLPMVMAADMLYVLDGYETSAGAKAEIALAEKLHIRIAYQDGADLSLALLGLQGSE